MEKLTKILTTFSETTNLIVLFLVCVIICAAGQYRSFGFIEWGTFKLSFDFIFFIALVGAITSSLILLWKILVRCCLKVKKSLANFFMLKTLKNCTPEEKNFLYNRLYENDNEFKIDMDQDSYFYREETIDLFRGGSVFKLYRHPFDTKKKVIKFLRQLENKKILQIFDNKSMIIPIPVWKLLTKNTDKIFKNFVPLVITPTEDKIKLAKITYTTFPKKLKDILRRIMLAPSSEYPNVKILDRQLASQTNMLQMYQLFNEFKVEHLPNVSIVTLTTDLYFILETILKEDVDAE